MVGYWPFGGKRIDWSQRSGKFERGEWIVKQSAGSCESSKNHFESMELDQRIVPAVWTTLCSA